MWGEENKVIMIKKRVRRKQSRNVNRKDKVRLKRKSNSNDLLIEDVSDEKYLDVQIGDDTCEENLAVQNISVRGRRKPCGNCPPCKLKENCGECMQCINRKKGKQICRLRKCIEIAKEQKYLNKLKKKKVSYMY